MTTAVRVSANFPELPASQCDFTARGSGSTKKSAISDAIRNVLADPKLKGKRYTTFSLKVFILGEDTSSTTDSTED